MIFTPEKNDGLEWYFKCHFYHRMASVISISINMDDILFRLDCCCEYRVIRNNNTLSSDQVFFKVLWLKIHHNHTRNKQLLRYILVISEIFSTTGSTIYRFFFVNGNTQLMFDLTDNQFILPLNEYGYVYVEQRKKMLVMQRVCRKKFKIARSI